MSAYNGEDGVAKYFEFAPDILFLDINLPDVSGLDILKFLAENDSTSHIIMITADASQSVVTKAISLGAEGYVRKPFNKKLFQQYIHQYKKKKKIAS